MISIGHALAPLLPRRSRVDFHCINNPKSASLRHVAHDLDVVAVGITYEGTVVVRVVLGPETRFVKHFCSRLGRGIKERSYDRAIRRSECDVALTKAFAGLSWPDPELRIRINPETDDVTEVHDATGSERREHAVVERSTRPRVGTLNRQMIEHGDILWTSIVTG